MKASLPRTTLKDYLYVYARTIHLVWESDPFYTIFIFATTILSAIAAPAQIWISKLVIDRLGKLAASSGTFETVVWSDLLVPFGLYIGIWAASEFFRNFSSSAANLLSIKIINYAQYRLVKKASSLSVAFYENAAYYDRLELARNQIWRFGNAAFFITSMITQVVSLAALVVLLAQVNLILPVILIVTVIPRLALQSYYINRRAALEIRYAADERMASYLNRLLASREAVKEVRLFGLQDYFLDAYRKFSHRYFHDYAKIALSQEKINFLMSGLSLLGTAGIWAITISEAVARRITLGDIAIVFQAAERARFELSQFSVYMGFSIENVIFLGNYFAFLDMPPGAAEGSLETLPASQVRRSASELFKSGGIEFSHVSFHYPGSQKLVLQDVSFTIEPGQALALVGENGAGKTTLVKLLTRLYDPTGGRILLGGYDLREFEPEELYREIGVIFQDFARYDFSASDNIGMGNIQEIGHREKIRRAAQSGGALDLIEKLPRGFDTILGKQFEGGVDLSGGEWQKVALSRAFLREASLLILDEPTAALDAFAENDVYTRFASLTAGKTTVFVTHRLSSVQMAHKIIVLQAGRLIEAGDHSALMEQDGVYAKMFRMQAERYQPLDSPKMP